MELRLHVTPSRAPVPLGAVGPRRQDQCYGQADTYSYLPDRNDDDRDAEVGFIQEAVTGTRVTSTGSGSRVRRGGRAGRRSAVALHEWRTINLDNGVDLSIWRQFDRTDHNALQPFSGATTSSPEPGADPECAEDIEVTVDGLCAVAGRNAHAGSAAV